MAHSGMWWVTWKFSGSFGDAVAHLEMLWIIKECSGSFGDVVFHH